MPLSCYYDSDDSEDYESYVSPPPRYSNIHSSRGTYHSHRSSCVSSIAYPSYESRRVFRQAYDSYSPSSATYSSYGSRRVSSLAYDSHSPSPTTYSYESRRVSPQAYESYSPSSTTYPSVPHSSHSYDLPSPSPRERHLIELERKKQAIEEESKQRRKREEKEDVIWADYVRTRRENDAKAILAQRRRRASVLIQSHIRGFVQRRSFKRMTRAVLVIQSRVRGLLQRQWYQRVQRATLIAQRFARQWIERKRTSSLMVVVPPYEPLRRPLTFIDLLQRFDQSLLSSARDPFLMFDNAPEGKSVGLDMSPGWVGHGDDLWQFDQIDWDPGDTEPQIDTSFFTPPIDMIICSAGLEGATPLPVATVFYQLLGLRPPPKPPKVRGTCCSSVRPASEFGTARQMIYDSGAQCRPPAKPPWKP